MDEPVNRRTCRPHRLAGSRNLDPTVLIQLMNLSRLIYRCSTFGPQYIHLPTERARYIGGI